MPIVAWIAGGLVLSFLGFELFKKRAAVQAAVHNAIPQTAAASAATANAALQTADNRTNQQAAASSNATVAANLLNDDATVNAMTQAVSLPIDRLEAIAQNAGSSLQAMLTVSLDANPGADTTAVAVSVAQTVAAMQ